MKRLILYLISFLFVVYFIFVGYGTHSAFAPGRGSRFGGWVALLALIILIFLQIRVLINKRNKK